MAFYKKILPIIFLSVVLGLVIWQVEPPQALSQTSPLQFFSFFTPLFLLFTFLANLFFKFYLKSFITSLGIILIFILKSLDILNIVTFVLTTVAAILIIKSFKKPKQFKSQTKIPKLSHLEKQK